MALRTPAPDISKLNLPGVTIKMKTTKRLFLMLCVMAALGCGGGSAASSETESDETSGGEEEEAVDLSPETLLSRYESNGRALQRDWSPGSEVAQHADDAMSVLRTYADGRGYVETFLTLEVVSADWSVGRHRATGIVTNRSINAIVIARFPDGHCMQYAGSFFQEAVGDDFADQLTTQGLGGGVRVPCEMADVVAQRDHIAQ
jgi:hypothetical protein